MYLSHMSGYNFLRVGYRSISEMGMDILIPFLEDESPNTVLGLESEKGPLH